MVIKSARLKCHFQPICTEIQLLEDPFLWVVLVFVVLGIKPKDLCMLGTHFISYIPSPYLFSIYIYLLCFAYMHVHAQHACLVSEGSRASPTTGVTGERITQGMLKAELESQHTKPCLQPPC